MKVLTSRQIREADKATIEREPISSLDLMERAAIGIVQWIMENIDVGHRLVICCGKGGNGGDGLAMARILTGYGRECAVLLGAAPDELTDDARANFVRLPEEVEVYNFAVEQPGRWKIPDIEPGAVIVDALLGVGMTGEVREPLCSIIEWINALPNRVISIDIPSGMRESATSSTSITTAMILEASAGVSAGVGVDAGMTSDSDNDAKTNISKAIVRAETTLTIEFPKLAMLLPETGEYAGNVVVIPIGLDDQFIAKTETPYYYVTHEWVESLRLPRAKFSHKGNYGHALLVCGSATMPGAAILATGGALRSGCGLVSVHIPKAERFALIANHPSAMLSLDDAEYFSAPPEHLEHFSVIGAGCGLGRNPKTVEALGKLLAAASGKPASQVSTPQGPGTAAETAARAIASVASSRKIPMVLDADALNIIAENPNFKRLIPVGSVLTPHPGELRRLVGDWTDDREKLEKASELARETRSIVIIKGAHSVICTSDGRFLFNSTGTPGMAKGGSGDVLAGLITGLIARGYDAETASIIGVYTHGRAGERAAELYGEEAMNASDLAEFL